MRARTVARIAPVALCVALAGCGPSKGTVSGKVTHKGKPVVWGSVTLIASDGVQYAGQITPEGTYTVPHVPGGAVKIAVASPNPDGTSRGGPAAARGGSGDRSGEEARQMPPPGAWFALPEKYGDPAQSGLTGTVSGDTTIDLDLP